MNGKKTLPPDFPKSMTGLEIVNEGWGAVAHEAGFVWPDDWQYRFTENEPFVTEGQNSMSLDATYRINPERLKPKAPVVLKRPTVKTEGGYVHLSSNYIQLDSPVRRRLSEDAGVDWRKVSEICMKIQLGKLEAPDAPNRIMQLIADAAVEVKE